MRQILLRDNKIDRDKEHFWIICLANNNLISNIELVSLGSVNATIVRPMNVFRIAEMKGAVKEAMEKAIDMAKGMKRKGYPIEDIVELSDLSKEEIEKLRV
jgi:hypothetical protein